MATYTRPCRIHTRAPTAFMTWGHRLTEEHTHTSHMHLLTLKTLSTCPHIAPICTKSHYALTHTSWWPHRRGLYHHTHLLFHTFDKHSLGAYCVPGAVPGDEDTAMNNKDKTLPLYS